MIATRILAIAFALALPAAAQAATHGKPSHIVHPRTHVTKIAAKRIHHVKPIAHPGAQS